MKIKYKLTLTMLATTIFLLVSLLLSRPTQQSDPQLSIASIKPTGGLAVFIDPERDGTYTSSATVPGPSVDGYYYELVTGTGKTVCEANGTTVAYNENTGVVTITGKGQDQCYLYFRRKAKVTVTFNPNGGTVSETSRSVDYKIAIGTLPTPTYNEQITGYGPAVSITSSGTSQQTVYGSNYKQSDYANLSASGFTFSTTTNTWTSTVTNSARATITFNPVAGPTVFCGSVQTLEGYGNLTVYVNGTVKYGASADYYTNWAMPNAFRCVWIGELSTSDTVEVTYYAASSGNARGNNIATFMLAGYITLPKNFTGWYSAKSGGTQYSATSTFTAATTMYARWSRPSVTLTYNNNGGSGCSSASGINQSLPVGASITMCTPTKSGYYFRGWWTATSGGAQVSPISRISSNMTVYARWSSSS